MLESGNLRLSCGSSSQLKPHEARSKRVQELSHNASPDVPSIPFSALRRSGSWHQGPCPFHHDTNPSLTIYPNTGTYFCFGCEAKGRAILEGFSYVLYPWGSKDIPYTRQASPVSRLIEPPPLTDDIKDVLSSATGVYYATLYEAEGASALTYLTVERGLDAEIIAQYVLGYASGETLPSIRSFRELGLVRADGKDFFFSCILYPNFDVEDPGKVSYITGRGFPEKKHLRPPSARLKRSSLYLEAFARQHRKTAIIVEGETDTLTLRMVGQNALGLYGAHSFDHNDAKRLREAFDTIVIACDGDNAGIKAAHKIARLIGPKAKILYFPKGFVKPDGSPIKDWNELYVYHFNKDKRAFGEFVQGRIDRRIGGKSYVQNKDLEDTPPSDESPINNGFSHPYWEILQKWAESRGHHDLLKKIKSCYKLWLRQREKENQDNKRMVNCGCGSIFCPRCSAYTAKQKKGHLVDEFLTIRDALIDNGILTEKDPYLITYEITLLKKASEYLDSLILVDIDRWNYLRNDLRKALRKAIEKIDGKSGGYFDAHFVSTANPTDPHYHENVLMVPARREGAFKWGKVTAYMDKQRGEDLEYVNKVIAYEVGKWAKRNNLPFEVPEKLNVRRQYINNIPKLHHKARYVVRPAPIQDLLDNMNAKDDNGNYIYKYTEILSLSSFKNLKAIGKALKRSSPIVNAVLNSGYLSFSLNLKKILGKTIKNKKKRVTRQRALTEEELFTLFDKLNAIYSPESRNGSKYRSFKNLIPFGFLAHTVSKKYLAELDLERVKPESKWERDDDYYYALRKIDRKEGFAYFQKVTQDIGYGYKFEVPDGEIIKVPLSIVVWDKPYGVVKVRAVWRKKEQSVA